MTCNGMKEQEVDGEDTSLHLASACCLPNSAAHLAGQQQAHTLALLPQAITVAVLEKEAAGEINAPVWNAPLPGEQSKVQ